MIPLPACAGCACFRADVDGVMTDGIIYYSPSGDAMKGFSARDGMGISLIRAAGIQTAFQEAKLQLLVKPHVTADGSIAMHVRINRDEPDFNQTSARGDPTILKREAETDLLIMDGHTAVIGGIYTRNTGRNLDQVPFFGVDRFGGDADETVWWTATRRLAEATAAENVALGSRYGSAENVNAVTAILNKGKRS